MCRSCSPTDLRALGPSIGRTSTLIDGSDCCNFWPSRARWLRPGRVSGRTTMSCSVMRTKLGAGRDVTIVWLTRWPFVHPEVGSFDHAHERHCFYVLVSGNSIRQIDGPLIEPVQFGKCRRACVGIKRITRARLIHEPGIGVDDLFGKVRYGLRTRYSIERL